MDPLTDAALDELFEDVLGEDYEAGATTAADILSAVHENGTGIARGVVVHDHRFGNETDDVVAELTATLGDEPISFAQVGKREDALQIRAGDAVQWVSFVPDGLTGTVAWLNRRLEEAGAHRRIFELDTEADYHCYLVCSPIVVASMKRRR